MPKSAATTSIEHALQIRWMIRRDMAEVLDIDESVFSESRWSEDDFLTALRQRNCIGMVAYHQEQIVGFMIYELHKVRLHVLRFAVATWHQRSGIGTALVNKLVAKLAQQRRETITLLVREDNLGAQQFYRACGFKAVDVIREHYQDGADAYEMWFHLGDGP